jgi:hypothetical protein
LYRSSQKDLAFQAASFLIHMLSSSRGLELMIIRMRISGTDLAMMLGNGFDDLVDLQFLPTE